MTDKDKALVAEELKASIREMAKNWPEEDTNYVHVMCTGIERSIPPGSTHEDAIKALEYSAQARRFGVTEKGAMFLMMAESARKDFLLFEGAVKGEKFSKPGRGGGPIRKKIAALLKKSPAMKNPELWESVIKKLPRGWSAFDNRSGKYLEGPTTAEHMTQGRFFNVCGEERNKIKQ